MQKRRKVKKNEQWETEEKIILPIACRVETSLKNFLPVLGIFTVSDLQRFVGISFYSILLWKNEFVN